MEWNKQTVKSLLLVICSSVAFYVALQNLGAVVETGKRIIEILTPFLLGGTIAFVLNVPMRAIERNLFPPNQRQRKASRPLSLILTLLALGVVLALAVGVIAPGVENALGSLVEQIPDALKRLGNRVIALEPYLPQLETFLVDLTIDWKELSETLIALLNNWVRKLFSSGGNLLGGVISGLSTFLIGLIFSFYILLQKEKLAGQGRQILYALLPVRQADKTLEILRMANRTFSSFLSGQCLEAVILGAMFFVAMTLFRMPYALLVGVLIALTALIPIVGAFIGCIVGALLIAIIDPWKALMFVVLFLVIQQIEGNLIYPHVVGSSVGLPSIWVLAAVSLGASLMGVLGMLVFIPFCSILYALFRDFVKRRLTEKKIPSHKWNEPPNGI